METHEVARIYRRVGLRDNRLGAHMTTFNSPWNPITTAPAGVELELCVHDGDEYQALAFPCRRSGVGWSDVRLNKMVPIS
jgi:hypothetical protein